MFLLPAIICATAVHSGADSTKPRDGWIAADFQGLDDYPGNQLTFYSMCQVLQDS